MSELTKQSAEQATKPSTDSALSAVFGDGLAEQGKGRAAVPKLTGFTAKGATELKEKSRTSDTADLSAQTATDTGKPKGGLAIPKLTGLAPKNATEKKEASTTETAARLYSQTAPYRDVPVTTPKPSKVVVPPPNPTELLKPVERKKVKRGEPLAVTSGQCDLVQVTIKGNPHPLLLKESKSQGGQLKAGDDLKWEAATLAKLDHPCIMKIHGYLPAEGEQQEGILIQKVENAKSSKDRAAGWTKELNTGAKTPAKVVGFLTKTLQPICQALDVVEAMEKQNLVHNDLNPENLLINDKGELTVIDFGSARPQGQAVKKCAEFYGAPELEEAALTGQGGCTSKSDVFSLGRVIATTIQEGDLKLKDDTEAAKEIALQVSQLAALRRSMCQTKPADRPTAAEAKAALKKILHDLSEVKV